jgi:hypothetical protein
MGFTAPVLAISITTRADCCWTALGGARILLGASNWTGPASEADFQLCSAVPASGVPRGQRMTFVCGGPEGIRASQVAIYLPKKFTSLTLCEVDVTLGELGASAQRKVALRSKRAAARKRGLLAVEEKKGEDGAFLGRKSVLRHRKVAF